MPASSRYSIEELNPLYWIALIVTIAVILTFSYPELGSSYHTLVHFFYKDAKNAVLVEPSPNSTPPPCAPV